MAEAVFSDRALQLREADEGDTVSRLIHQHARLVYRIAYSVLRDHHEAEDAAQETFMRVLRHQRQLRRVLEHKAWLVRIAWRVAVSRRKKRIDVSLDGAEKASAIAQLQSQLTSAEDFSLGREMAELLQSLISSLPTQLREVLALYSVQELTLSEIAEVLGISESAVRSRMFRAREILKEKLSAALEGKHGRY